MKLLSLNKFKLNIFLDLKYVFFIIYFNFYLNFIYLKTEIKYKLELKEIICSLFKHQGI